VSEPTAGIDQFRTPRATCLLAPNPSPMTLDGTNTWLIAEPGAPSVVVVDPGPDDEGHLRRVHAEAVAGDRRVGVGLLLPGHGPMLADPLGTLDYYLSHRAERLDQVRSALAAGAKTPAEIVAMIYTDVDPSVWPAAEWSVRAQLDYLNGL